MAEGSPTVDEEKQESSQAGSLEAGAFRSFLWRGVSSSQNNDVTSRRLWMGKCSVGREGLGCRAS